MHLSNIKIIIWCNDNYNTLGLLRQLKDVCQNIHLLVLKNNYCATSSKYCNSYIAKKTLSEGLSYLLDYKALDDERLVLITTSDLIAEYVDLHSPQLESKYIIQGTPDKSVSYYLDKYNMAGLAAECGIESPKTCRLNNQLSIDTISFPVIVKPARKYENKRNLFKTRRCNSAEELKGIVAEMSEDDNYIIQEYVEKNHEILLYGCRNLDGSLYIPGVFIKFRWCDGGDGSFGVLTRKIPDGIDLLAIEKFLSRINYVGLFSFEYGVSNKGVFYYETNFRNDGTSHYFYQAGVNVPAVWLLNSLGIDYSSLKSSPMSDTCFIDEIGDKDNIKNGIITDSQWKRDFKKAKAFKYYDKNDLKPYCIIKARCYLYSCYSIIKPFIKCKRK